MARLPSFASISQKGLLGNPYGEEMTSLLGLDPSAMRRQALSSGLANAGFTLMGTTNYGDVGSAFLQGANSARDDYMRNALLGHQMRTAAEDREYRREQDKLEQERWEKSFGLQQGANTRANTEFDWQMGDRQREEDMRAGQQTYVNDWLQDQRTDAGMYLLPRNVQQIARDGGVAPMEPPDPRYDQAQRSADAGLYEQAYTGINTALPQPEEFTLGENQIRYRGTQPIAAGPGKQPTPTDDMHELDAINAQRQAAGMPPLRLDEWLTAKGRAGAPQNNIGLEGDSYAKERGKAFATSMGEYEAAEKSAFDTLASVDAMQNFMQDENFYSGWGGQIALNAKQFLSTMGGDPNAAASMEAFNAESKRMALANMGGSLGTGFSNADRDFVNYQVANLDTSMQGNQSLLEINRRVAERKIQIAQMAREYEIKNGRIDARFRQELSQWALANPLFPEAEDMNIQQQRPALADPLGIR
jgi:hypothetical protein